MPADLSHAGRRHRARLFAAAVATAVFITGSTINPPPSFADDRREVCAVDLFVREAADGPPVGTLYRGETFTVERTSPTGRWAYGMAYGKVNRHGWVLASYLATDCAPEPSAPTVAPPVGPPVAPPAAPPAPDDAETTTTQTRTSDDAANDEVTAHASRARRLPSACRFTDPTSNSPYTRLAGNPNVEFASEQVRNDVCYRRITAQLARLLNRLARHHHITISMLRTGHSQFVNGTSVTSSHFCGRGADISRVDHRSVTGSEDPRDPGRLLAEEILSLERNYPDEFGQPWGDLEGPGVFSDAAHQDHLHIGFDGPPTRGPGCH